MTGGAWHFQRWIARPFFAAVRASDWHNYLVWPKYPNALFFDRLRLCRSSHFTLNFMALSPILITHGRRLGRGERGMDWKKLLGSITAPVDEELRLRNAYLIAENLMLRQQITGRVPLTDGERKTLAELGQQLGKQALAAITTVARPDTILAWHRAFADQPCDHSQPQKSVGRPRIDKELEDLVVRMVRENRSWGYDRIVGALSHLGYRISDQTVGNVLKRQGIPPAPERKKTVTWREFIRIHLDVLGATDFFSSELWTWYRLVTFSLPAFFSFGRCPLHLAGITALLNALRRWPIPRRSSAWRVAVARGIHTVMKPGMPLVLQRIFRLEMRYSANPLPLQKKQHPPEKS